MLRVLPAFLLLVPAPLAAQVYTRPDSAAFERAAAFAEMTHWVETTHGSSEQSVMLRNNSKRPIQVVSYEVHECVNIPSRVCKVHEPGPVIEPGKTRRLVAVSRRRDDQEWSFAYRFTVRYAPPAPADTAGH
jgi:hypothetical protein